jgi:hypothetical protein
MRRNGVSGGAGIGCRAGETAREVRPAVGSRRVEGLAASLLQGPVPGVIELGGEERGVEAGLRVAATRETERIV